MPLDLFLPQDHLCPLFFAFMKPTQLTYSLGDPIPSGCKPYMYIQPKTGASKWYTTCERPLSNEVPQQNSIESVQPTQPVKQTVSTQSLPYYMSINNAEILSFISALPFYLILIACVSFALLILYLTSRFLLLKKKLKTKHVFFSVKPTKHTTESAISTEQLFGILHTLIGQKTFWERILHAKTTLSVELVATRDEGIQYLIYATGRTAHNIKNVLLSYLPGVEIQETSEYLPERINDFANARILSYRMSNHFSIPLKQHKVLTQHDPIAYLTGNMTKLKKDELISLQFVLSPVDNASNREKTKEAGKILTYLWKGKDIEGILTYSRLRAVLFSPLILIGNIIYWSLRIFFGLLSFFFDIAYGRSSQSNDMYELKHTLQEQERKRYMPTPSQKELYGRVQEKLDQPLFETSMRLFITANTDEEVSRRTNGITASLASFDNTNTQQIIYKHPLLLYHLPQKIVAVIQGLSFFFFKNRLLGFSKNLFLSTSELASIYHLPYTTTTKTEDLVTIKAKELHAPLSLKQSNTDLDIVFARNNYGGETTMIGLTGEERQRHVYMLGATGTGKSTLMLSMIAGDIQNGKGVCVIDPHGELAEKILAYVPEERKDDLIYFNPDDLEYPVGLNLLELTPGLSKADSLREKEFIAESVVSLFRKVFSKSSNDHAHRIEYILRNTIHTAFTLPSPTLFTLFDLLEDPAFRRKVVNNLTDEHLKKFWKYEFDKAGSWQQVKMVAPVTAKIGRFLFSPIAKGILEQEHSTINIDQAMNEGKILICNLAKGKLGEDTSEVLGILLLNKIELATLKRARFKAQARKDFYLYVDEFQNFATPSFVNMLSEARKYHLNVTIAEQTTSQIADKNLIDIIFANVCSVICFRTANSTDEKRILPIFSPYVQENEILNLPSYHFYMKIASLTPQEPFSGETMPLDKDEGDEDYVNSLIDLSREKYAIYSDIEQETEKEVTKKKSVTKRKTKKVKEQTPKQKGGREANDEALPGDI